MADADRQMPSHVEVAYQDAVNNITFLKRQQWIATNYALLVYAALFVVSAEYFSRTDFARNWLGIFAIVTFLVTCTWCACSRARWISLGTVLIGFTGPTSTEKNKLAWVCSGHDHLGMNGKSPLGLSLSRLLVSS
jgi:O-antigen ligase